LADYEQISVTFCGGMVNGINLPSVCNYFFERSHFLSFKKKFF